MPNAEWYSAMGMERRHDARADHPGAGRGRRGRRDDLLQARPGARARVRAGAAGHPRARARTPASTRARSTASRPTATTATIRRAWPPRSACPSCASRTCSGAAAGAAARRRSATRRPRSPRATPTAWWSSARSPRASSSASAPRRPAAPSAGEAALTFPYGLISPAQRFAMRVMRFMHDHGVRQEAQRAIALASYHHAQANPRAVMHGRPLTAEAYDASRWIVEPFRLFDCCMENDGAAALVLVSAERARDLRQPPAYLLGVAQGSEYRNAARGHNAPTYASLELHHRGAAPLGDGRPRAQGRRRGAELRELHRRRAHEPGRARLLRARGGQRVPHPRRT